MNEQCITFETATLAEQKGFNDSCKYAHDNWGRVIDWEETYEELHKNSYKNASTYYSAPTQSLLQRWLREKHKIHITVDYNKNGKYSCKLSDSSDNSIGVELFGDCYITYEEALEKSLFEGLQLLPNK